MRVLKGVVYTMKSRGPSLGGHSRRMCTRILICVGPQQEKKYTDIQKASIIQN